MHAAGSPYTTINHGTYTPTFTLTAFAITVPLLRVPAEPRGSVANAARH